MPGLSRYVLATHRLRHERKEATDARATFVFDVCMAFMCIPFPIDGRRGRRGCLIACSTQCSHVCAWLDKMHPPGVQGGGRICLAYLHEWTNDFWKAKIEAGSSRIVQLPRPRHPMAIRREYRRTCQTGEYHSSNHGQVLCACRAAAQGCIPPRSIAKPLSTVLSLPW